PYRMIVPAGLPDAQTGRVAVDVPHLHAAVGPAGEDSIPVPRPEREDGVRVGTCLQMARPDALTQGKHLNLADKGLCFRRAAGRPMTAGDREHALAWVLKHRQRQDSGADSGEAARLRPGLVDPNASVLVAAHQAIACG